MPRLAVLIDAENIEDEYADQILNRVRKVGDPNIVRLFADFSGNRETGWLTEARTKGYEPVFQLNGGARKNSTDIALAIDAMDILFSGAVDGFFLVSDDRDILPLARRLRAAGKRVYVICKTVDSRLRQVCSGVIPLVPKTRADAVLAAPELNADEREFIADLITDLCEVRKVPSVLPSLIGEELKRRDKALADRIGGPRLIGRLLREGIVVEHGAGATKTISSIRQPNLLQTPSGMRRRVPC